MYIKCTILAFKTNIYPCNFCFSPNLKKSIILYRISLFHNTHTLNSQKRKVKEKNINLPLLDGGKIVKRKILDATDVNSSGFLHAAGPNTLNT